MRRELGPLSSWVEPNLDRYFQLMEYKDPKLLEMWSAQWEDLVSFEFVPVVTSAEMAERMNAKELSGPP